MKVHRCSPAAAAPQPPLPPSRLGRAPHRPRLWPSHQTQRPAIKVRSINRKVLSRRRRLYHATGRVLQNPTFSTLVGTKSKQFNTQSERFNNKISTVLPSCSCSGSCSGSCSCSGSFRLRLGRGRAHTIQTRRRAPFGRMVSVGHPRWSLAPPEAAVMAQGGRRGSRQVRAPRGAPRSSGELDGAAGASAACVSACWRRKVSGTKLKITVCLT